jgi:tRNA(Ile)-lysidine synthase
VLVAVSGGADSTALLLGLAHVAQEFGVELHAAHLNHRLRGPESDGDEAFVQALCERLSVPLVHAAWNTSARMRRRGLSGEAGLRTLRREFLLAAAQRLGARALATAHTADDQLETMLLRLGRGAGLRGLGGISPRRGRWLRPLLEVTRDEIESDLRAAGQSWRDDSSNRSLTHARNRVRHVVVPALLQAIGSVDSPSTRGSLARRASEGARELQSAGRALGDEARRLRTRFARIQDGEIALDSKEVRSYPYALRRLLLRDSWRALKTPSEGLTHRHLTALDRLLRSHRGGAQVALPHGYRAVRARDIVTIGLIHESAPLAPIRLTGSGQHLWPGGQAESRWMSAREARQRLAGKRANEEFFAAGEVKGMLQLRHGRPDELFVPFGRVRSQRLGPFLTRARVSRAQRAHPLVLADSEGILWVIGVRRSARAPLTRTTRKALWVQTERHD